MPRPHDPRPVQILVRSRFRGYSKSSGSPLRGEASRSSRLAAGAGRPRAVAQGTAHVMPPWFLRKVSVVKTGRGRRPIQATGCRGSDLGRTKRLLAIPLVRVSSCGLTPKAPVRL